MATKDSLEAQIAEASARFSELRKQNAEPALVEEAKTKLGQLKQSFALLYGGGKGADKKKERLLLKTAKHIERVVKDCFTAYGGSCLETPVFERKDVLTGKYGEDSKLIYDLKDQGGEELALRYDHTVPLARYLAMGGSAITQAKLWQLSKVYRRDQPVMSKGRMREFSQADFDIAGTWDPMIPDAEIISLVCTILTKLDVGEYTIKLNHRKILDGIFEVCGVPADKIRTISSAVDKLDKSPWSEVKKEMTEEKGLDAVVADKIGEYVKHKGGPGLLDQLLADETLMANANANQGLSEMGILFTLLRAYNVVDRISFDLSLARGLDYYTGVIYEATVAASAPPGFSTANALSATSNSASATEPAVSDPAAPSASKPPERKTKKGKPVDGEEEEIDESQVGVGSIAAGGRYDNLVGMFNAAASGETKKGKAPAGLPCVGIAIGLDRVFAVVWPRWVEKGMRLKELMVFVMAAGDGLLEERIRLVCELREAGISADYLAKTKPKLSAQFAAGDRDEVPFAVILGADELKEGLVTVKEQRWELVDGRKAKIANEDKGTKEQFVHHPYSLRPYTATSKAMPPRRSTRSRASVEPVPEITSSATKRKRPSQAELDVSTEDHDTVDGSEGHAKYVPRSSKPPSRRSAATKPHNTSRSTRSRGGLREIEEGDEGVPEMRPTKKRRPSSEAEAEDVDGSDLEEPKKRVSKATARKSSTANTKRTSTTSDQGLEEEAIANGASTSTTKSRTSKGRKPSTVHERTGRVADGVKAEPDVPEANGPSARGRKASSTTNRSVKNLFPAEGSVMDGDGSAGSPKVEDDEREVAAQIAPSATEGKPEECQPTPEDSLRVDAEEEVSLLDPEPHKRTAPNSRAGPAVEEPKEPRSRLVIHKMALVNFKSYAGRQEIGPFHKSFSAIVGPNGSGKSNTIDALLFVFGYRASKMRQGKLSELIHNSARYPDLDFCSVEVHFREIIDLPGPDAFEVVPKSQLVVARTAYKDNSSTYTINGRKTVPHPPGKQFSLKIVGEVESIALMKPKATNEHDEGLLEYLEDIIGTSKYKEPIEEALQQMDQLSEERVEKLNRLRIVEREKNKLDKEKKEAEDYLRLQNEHVRALSRLWQYYIWQCLRNDEQYAHKISRLDKDLKDLQEQNKDDISHVEMLEKHYEERQQAYEEVRTLAAAAMKDLAANEKQQVSLEERRKHANSKGKKLKKSLQDDDHARNEALRAIEDNTAKIEKNQMKLEELQDSLVAEEKILDQIADSLRDKTQIFHDQIEKKQRELQPWNEKANKAKAELEVAQSERNELSKKAEAAQFAMESAQEELDQLNGDQDTKTSGLNELKDRKTSLQRDVTGAEKRLQDARRRVQDLQAKAASSRQRTDEARASQTASTSQNKGRLGSLGTIPDKYDVAITTACPSLNNLVVNTVEEAQSCIEHLRRQNAGRASFMILEKLHNRGMDKISTPENVPRLFDLITPKERQFAPAFYKAVGNTLVADDLEQANRIAFGARRWRVVTLNGQLIDSSGTMAGGGTRVNRGGMSSKLAADAVDPATLRRYERESEEAHEEFLVAQNELRQIEVEVEGLSRSGPQIEVAMEKITLDIETGKRRIAEAEKRLRELRSQNKPNAEDAQRIAALDESIAASEEELSELRNGSAAIEKAIKDLEKKILEIGGSKLLAQRSKVDGIRLHINLANDEITKAEVAIDSDQRKAKKLEGTIATNKANLEDVEAELDELTEQLGEVTDYVEKLRSKVQDAQAAAENSKDDLDSLKAELDEKMEDIQAFRQKEQKMKQTLDDTRKESLKNEEALEHWNNEHDKLKLEEIDEEDPEEEPEQPRQQEALADSVKPDPDAAPVKKAHDGTPANELCIYEAEELAKFKKDVLLVDEQLLDEKLKNAKPNLSVLKEYKKREEEFLKRATDLEETTKLRDAKKAEYDSLRKQRLDEFMAGFSLISLKLKEMYQMITLGGNAELELVDSMDPFSEGIIFSVMPPKKSWKNISNLSGGEKARHSSTLTAGWLADPEGLDAEFFGAGIRPPCFQGPTPLYFMDEIDAALDFRNVSIVANYIKDRTKNAQFIIISLRNDMFELSHRLIGIYKTANTTKSKRSARLS
ncbi:hypothetical protein PUNSTDRAFT_129962 [Punctularia strigosozonata HHB-11173 SS5]|uniref:uncharacterized protein n=1 Tax=Punctularia strigosozonata (strain HHB-11173) TaxID=741275 RepID=UPI00044174BD|nr:uncharacterized protein PUNSTDRAFT_129962 [Punctularia strigosozonata HHB-11173 SS5]EIN14323.1 hypothetical protein PUNSTDRAFT_129962 [Punctularia strigosozonata HHB-11173 SS5]